MRISRQDKIRGSLVGGAIGDALGYPVEFMSYSQIIARYGGNGITRFTLTDKGVAEISDDTQMTLFTANGILFGMTRVCMRGIACNLYDYVGQAYEEWLQTQTEFSTTNTRFHTCWIRDIAALNSRRAPGNTCLSALMSLRDNKEVNNDSKGCGGVMRVAPVGLVAGLGNGKETILNACACAAITHKHPLGFLPAGLLACIIRDILDYGERLSSTDFEKIVHNACKTLEQVYDGDGDASELRRTVNTAMALAKMNGSDKNNIKLLGEGWTGDEALAIAIYCSLRHLDNFEDAVIAAVNHDGDSDSTGAICGNIMGAICGYDSIPKYYKENLELADVIFAMADDISTGCIISEYGDNDNLEQLQWRARYIHAYPHGFPHLEMRNIQTHYEIPDLCSTKPEEYVPDVERKLKEDIPEFFFFNNPNCMSEEESMLSIWWPCKIHIEGTVYNSVGQYMQAEKARIFGDLATRNKIIAASDKYDILRLGKSIFGYDERRWRNVCYAVAVCGNFYKFSEDVNCKEALLSTKNLILVKDSDYDTFWGVGCSRKNPQIKNPGNWKGKNMLGFALMKVRDILNSIHRPRFSYGGQYIFSQEDKNRMDSLQSIQEKIAFKNKIIEERKYTVEYYIWTESGKFVCKYGTLIYFEPSDDNIISKENGLLVLKNLVIPSDEKNIRYIADGLFNNIEVRSDVHLPWTLAGIGRNGGTTITMGVFNRCILKNVYIPKDVELLGDYVFYNSRIETLKIYRKSLLCRYGRQFKGAKIKNLYLPDCSVNSIEKGQNVFHSISINANVENVYFDNYVHMRWSEL